MNCFDALNATQKRTQKQVDMTNPPLSRGGDRIVGVPSPGKSIIIINNIIIIIIYTR